MFGDREFLDISKDQALSDLRDLFGLKTVPARIEGFDISHMSGTDAVASMVVFTNGVSDRAQYRKFKMTKQRNDDTANMHETIFRRFSEKNIKAWGKPDLVLVDGRKGQRGAAIAAMQQRNVAVPVIGLAKRDEEIVVHKVGSTINNQSIEELLVTPPEGLYIKNDGEYYIINLHAGQLNASGHSKNLRGSDGTYRYSEVTKLFQRIRDESHRFAVSYHSNLKRAGQTKSVLEDIPGVGAATRKKLIKAFGSVRSLSNVSEQDLAAVVGASKATVILAYLAGK
jgi:excinuclease ABC subunit C